MAAIHLPDHATTSPDGPQRSTLVDVRNLKANLHALAPGQHLHAHVHDDLDKVFLVVSGRLCVEVGGDESELGPQDMVLVPAGATHGARNDGTEDASLLVVVARHG